MRQIARCMSAFHTQALAGMLYYDPCKLNLRILPYALGRVRFPFTRMECFLGRFGRGCLCLLRKIIGPFMGTRTGRTGECNTPLLVQTERSRSPHILFMHDSTAQRAHIYEYATSGGGI